MNTKGRDLFHLDRFLIAQEGIYSTALAEIKSGQKSSHWMWFIFPQIVGLGMSETSQFYAIQSREEAFAYLGDPVLGAQLVECTQAVLAVENRTAAEIFGFPDDLKLKSCMTLFGCISKPFSIFEKVLEKYFHGEKDLKTLEILHNLEAVR